MTDNIKLESADADTSPSVIKATGDDIHTRNIKAVAEVVRSLRDDMTKHHATIADLSKTVHTLQTEIGELKMKLILMQHQGSGATAR
jgi:phage shock protein A